MQDMKYMKHLKIYIRGLVLAGMLASCMENTLVSTTYDYHPDPADTDLFLRVNVPRTYATSGDGATKETLITGIDVLVFSPGIGEDADKYYLKSASEGTPLEDGKKFQVTMPVGEGLMIHVFTNCHQEIVKQGAYREIGMELEALTSRLTIGINNNAAGVDCLPMHGFLSNVSITKESAGTLLTVPALRSVAAVQVITNATRDADGNLSPGDIKDPDTGEIIFKLREFYAYFPADSGRVAPRMDAYEPETDATKDKTRDVIKATIPRYPAVLPIEDKYVIKSAVDVKQLGSLYLYENTNYSDNGYDQPGAIPGNDKVATTRLVVGGVYRDDKQADGVTPKVTYYRIDIADAVTSKLAELLRNHKYTFNITGVSNSGYDKPDDAATGVPINIEIQVIDWTNVDNNVDFDKENWFSTETKNIAMPRNKNSVRSINVETDVKFGSLWTLSFGFDNNGVTVPVKIVNGAMTGVIENDRYKVEVKLTSEVPNTKATLSVTVKHDYSDAPVTPASRNEKLVIKVKNLNVNINITQLDISPDDWGNGGNQDTNFGENDNPVKVPGVDVEDWGSGTGQNGNTEFD